MPPSIPRASARLHSPGPSRLPEDENANSAIIPIAGIGAITLTGLIAWFFVGSIMMTLPGIIGFMGFVAAALAVILLVANFAPKG
jgi:hypothetical protein